MPAPNYSDVIEKNMLGHIKYRDAIRTGEIITDNGDGTYDVKIALSDKIYPSVETLTYEMKFAVGEIAVLSFEYGNKESPKIMGHGKKIAQDPVEVEVGYSGTARVNTLDAYGITETTAYLENRIYLGGAGNCTKYGFYYGTSTGYGDGPAYTTGSFGSGSYNKQVTGLTGETTYHFQAYITDADGDEHTGEDKTFTTSEAGVVAGDIYIYHLNGTSNRIINVYNSNGNYLCSWGEPAELSGEYVRFMAVDASGNVYIGAGPNATWFDWIFKYDNVGNLLLSLDLSGDTYKPRGMVIAPDGKLYTNTRSSTTQYLVQQRNLTDLTVDDEISLTAGKGYAGKFVFDSSGNFYTHNHTNQRFERWTFAGGVQATYSSSPVLSWGSWETFATANSVLSCFYEYWTGDDMIFTIPTAFGEAYTRHDPTDITTGAGVDSALVDMASIGNNFLLIGKNSDGDLIIQKCNSSITKVWTTVVGSYSVVSGHRDAIIAAYPF